MAESSGAKITSDFVKSKLIQDNAKQVAEIWNQSSETALASSAKAKKATKIKMKVRCFNCNEVGHIKTECHKPKKGNAGATFRKGETTIFTAMSAYANSEGWYIDSGASGHMTKREDWLKNFSAKTKGNVTVANNAKLQTEGSGDAVVRLKHDSRQGTITNTMHVPGISANLLSVSRVVEKGLVVVFFSKLGCLIYHENDWQVRGDVIATATNLGDVYRLDQHQSKSML
jgi:hypothetical protein